MNVWKQWGLLEIGLTLILASVEPLVMTAVDLGDHFGTPSFLWG